MMVCTIIYEVGTIMCEVGTIMCDISTINVRFYLLKVPYPHGYCRITLRKNRILLFVYPIIKQSVGK